MGKGFFYKDASGVDYQCQCCKGFFAGSAFSGVDADMDLKGDADEELFMVSVSVEVKRYDKEGNIGYGIGLCPRCFLRMVERSFVAIKGMREIAMANHEDRIRNRQQSTREV